MLGLFPSTGGTFHVLEAQVLLFDRRSAGRRVAVNGEAQDAAALKTGDAAAAAPKTEKPGATSGTARLLDPAFEKFVDVRLLATAIGVHDSSLLTDLALQFAFAESVLDRQHTMFSAQEVATFALAAAAETHDKASLDRLARLAAKLNDSPLSTKIAVAKLETGKSRSATPPTMIAVDQLSPWDIEGFCGFERTICTLKILGDRSEIERRLSALEKQEGLPPELREQGILIAKGALATFPKDAKPSGAALAIERLLASPVRSDDDHYDDERVRVNEWGNRLDGTQGRYGAEAKSTLVGG